MSFTLFGAGFSFALPAALFALPIGAAALIAAYRSKGRLSPVLVSSTLLLRLLESKKPARQKFFPPLRFFLELLSLILLSLAAAGIYREGSGKRVALIVDDSFSTAAVNYLETGGSKVIDGIKLESRQLVRSLPGSSAIDLYLASGGYTPIENGISPVRAEERVSNLSFSYTSDSIESLLNRVAADPNYSEIVVITDKSPEISSTNGTDSRVRIAHRGLPDAAKNNVFISDLKLSSKQIGAPPDSILVSLRSQSADTFSGTLTASQVNEKLSGLSDKSEKVPVQLESGASERFSLPIKSQSAAYQVTLQPAPASRDAISEDNTAQIGLQGGQEKVVLVSPVPVSKLGLDKISVIKFLEVHPSELNDSIYNDPRYANAPFLFFATVPAALPPSSAAFIDPPESSEIFTVNKVFSGKEIQITSWNEQHPLTAYLNLPALKLSSVSPLVPPAWAETLITSTEGTAAFAGEVEGRKFAVVGFSLFPYRGKADPLTSVLTLNLLKWIAPFNSSSGYLSAPYQLKETTSVEAIGRSETFQGKVISAPGLYLAKGAQSAQPLIVNFFSDAESDLLGAKSLAYPPAFTGEVVAPKGESLTPLLLRIALGLLLLDLVLSSRFIGLGGAWKAA